MTQYQKAKLKIQEEMKSAIDALNAEFISVKDANYWNKYKELTAHYMNQLQQVDDAERQRNALKSVKATKPSSPNISSGYIEMINQLKASKMNEIITALASCRSGYGQTEVSASDPFYADKLDPIGTFERWWQQELQTEPSYEELKNFLHRVKVNSEGFLVYDNLTAVKESTQNSQRVSLNDLHDYQNLIRSDILKSSKQRAQSRNQQKIQNSKKRAPLLAKLGVDKEKKDQRAKLNAARIDVLCNVIYSYNLNPDLESLLIDHAEYVCIPKGLIREDQYKMMLDQFLRYVTEGPKRMHIVREAISKGWRILSDGSI